MSYKSLNRRQKNILCLITLGTEYSLRDLNSLLAEANKPSLPTLRRDIAELRDLGFLEQSGELKSAHYLLSPYGMLHSPIDAHAYCSIDVDTRPANSSYNFSLFKEITDAVFSKEDLAHLQNATRLYLK